MITNTLKILLWDKEIGRLSWDSKRGVGYFEYSREFLEGNLDVFPLIASISNPASRRPILGEKENYTCRPWQPYTPKQTVTRNC